METYLFGRLNLVAPYQDKLEYLMQLMNSRKYLRKRDYEWGFFDIELLPVDNHKFIFGHLCKYRPSDSEEVVDKNTGRIGAQFVIDHLHAKSPFFLHVSSGLLAFHPVPNQIRPNTFRRMFAKLLMHAQDNIFIQADVQMVHQEYEIFKAIRRFERIISIQIVLHPSNPSNRERWRRTNERLHKLKAHTFKQEYTNPDGLNIDEDDEVYGDIIMASDGYGKATVRGIMNGKDTTASTEQTPVKGEAPSDGPRKSILEHLLDTFKDIWDRMKEP